MQYFKDSEFKCPDGTTQCMSPTLLRCLDSARDIADVPFVLNSAFRTKEHNSEVGGVEDSPHLRGTAVDISTPDSRTRYYVLTGLILAALKDEGIIEDMDAAKVALSKSLSRFGIGENFIHVDFDTTKDPEVIWTYYRHS